jgi:ubiquinol-cytochrome c reductase cytochrome b subunit
MSFPWANEYRPQAPLMRWLDEKLPLPRLVYNAVGGGYPVPRNLNYWWNFGVLAGFMLVCRSSPACARDALCSRGRHRRPFQSVEPIMRNVNQGLAAALRPCERRRASSFIVVYIHIFRGLFYGSYKAPREMVWMLGLVIFLLMMATAFMGYVLPWGQMSFWGAKVITGLFGASRWSASRSRPGCSAASRPTRRRSTASSRSTICCRS